MGRSSLSAMPDWPCRANRKGEAIRFSVVVRASLGFSNGSGLFLAMKTINHNQDLVSADSRIAAEVLVVDVKEQSALANTGLKNVGDVDRVALNAVVAAKDG